MSTGWDSRSLSGLTISRFTGIDGPVRGWSGQAHGCPV
jgi:hypothetical protein